MRIMERKGKPEIRIRVRLSALVNFVVSIYRLIVSIAFTLIVIRRLDPSAYGLYAVLLSTANAVNTLGGTWIYWASRRHALGFSEALRASIIINTSYLAISIPLFIISITPITSPSIEPLSPVMLVILFYLAPTPLSIVLSLVNLYAPEKAGYLGLLFETVRVVLAYIFVINLGMGIAGAIMGPGIANLVLIAASFYLLVRIGVIDPRSSEEVRGTKRIYREVINILRLSILSIPSLVASTLVNLDKLIMGFIALSTIPAAYASVSSIPKSIITPGAFTSGLYAKILREPRAEDVTDILLLYSLASIYITITIASLSTPVITFFNPAYADGHILIVLASLEALILGYASIFETVAIAFDRSDIYSKRFSEIVRSPLGRIPLAQMISVILCISLASIAQLAIYQIGVRDPVLLVLPYRILYLASSIPYTYYVYRLSTKAMGFRIPWRDVAIFSVSSISVILISIVTGIDNIVINSFWRDLARIAPGVTISLAIYLVIGLALSNRIRALIAIGIRFIARGSKNKS